MWKTASLAFLCFIKNLLERKWPESQKAKNVLEKNKKFNRYT
jgi:hypothetical protein